MLTLQIKEKEIENLTPEEEFVRGTVGAKCQINFDEFWQSYNKYIVFKRVGYEPINFMVDTLENEIEIPYTILAESGEFKIGVFGTTETGTLPTLYSKDIKILYGTDTHGTTPPTYIPSEIDQLRLSKQDKLVSGENIKTVNGESILGSGNIKIQVEVDQTYSPTSANAQSGKAVAEAVTNEQKRADNTFANALKGSKSGGAFLIDDVSPVIHDMAVKVRGKNLILYPYVDSTKTVDDTLTFTDNGDGTITVDGESQSYSSFVFQSSGAVPAGTYYLSGCPSGGSSNTYCMVVLAGMLNVLDTGSGVMFTLNETTPVTIFIQISSAVTLSNVVFKPQLELGTTATAYTPYVPDLTAVKVTRCGKNLFNSQLLLNATGWSVDENGVYSGNPSYLFKLYKNGFPIVFQTGFTYTVSFYAKADLTADKEMALYIGFKYTDGTSSELRINITEYKLYKMTSTKDVAYMYVSYNLSRTTYIKDFMLEIGSTATDYEPYVSAEYTPTADGTVNGVTSLYPNTTLMTDTDGVIIDCEYNRDINKAFAELQQAIISLGGNV